MAKGFSTIFLLLSFCTTSYCQEIDHSKSENNDSSLSLVFTFFLFLLILALIATNIISLAEKRRSEKSLQKAARSALKIQQLESEKKQNLLQQKSAELEMQALRAQMNPHFIFNSLNAINHFVVGNETETASDYLTKFSRLIRMVLQNSEKKEITLAEEMETVLLYVELEKIRFADHFSYFVSCASDIDAEIILVPTMLLQPYVENAIWHGLMHKDSPGHLEITVEKRNEQIKIRIIDDGVGRKRAAELKSKSASIRKSMGMNIAAQRLKLFSPDDGETNIIVDDIKNEKGEEEGTSVTILFPANYNNPIS